MALEFEDLRRKGKLELADQDDDQMEQAEDDVGDDEEGIEDDEEEQPKVRNHKSKPTTRHKQFLP